MQRNVEALTGRRFDLLIVGGGIHGLFAACDAASRGFSTALVEAGDFGGGATFNHQRTLHGGLRALQAGNVMKTRRQIAERRAWAVIAPHFVRPLAFLLGTYRFTTRSRLVVRAGFTAYDLIGRRRNAGVLPELHLPAARLESRAATLKLFPGIRPAALAGGAIWYDYQTRHPERLTWCVALGAAAAGATLVNHARALAPLSSSGRVTGCTVRDQATGREVDVEAAVTLLAAGGELQPLHAAFGLADAPPVLSAMNVLVDRPARDIALAAPAASGRMLTAVPWAGRVLVGTHQSEVPVDPSALWPAAGMVDALLAEANTAFPALGATRADVRLVHHGLVPATTRGTRADLLADPIVIRHGRRGVPGVVSLVGVKYTTARAAAARAVDAVARDLGRSRGTCRTATAVLPHADIADAEGRLIESMRGSGLSLDPHVVDHLTGWYGTEAADVVTHAAGTGGLGRLAPELPVLDGEVTYAADRMSVVTLADIVLRRTALCQSGHPGAAVVGRAAALVAPRLGWTPERTAAECAAVAAALTPPPTAR